MAKSKRFIAAFLALFAFCLFCCGPLCQSAQALVGVDDAFIAVIIAALAAIGIVFVTSSAYSASRGIVADLMNDYAVANNTTVSDQLRGVQVGSSSLGKLLANNAFLVYLSGLALFIKAKYNLTNNSVAHIVTPGFSINGITAYRLPLSFSGYLDYEYEFTMITSDVPVYAFCVYNGGNYPTIYLFASQQAVVNRHSYNQYGQWNQQFVLQSSSVWAMPYVSYTNTDVGAGSGLIQVDYEDLLDAIGADKDVDINNIGTAIDIVTGDIVTPLSDEDYTPGDGAVIDVGADWGAGYRDITEGVIPDDFSDGKEGEATMTYEQESDVVDQVTEGAGESVSSDPEGYTVSGLADVFPFCIPFDIYAFFECLAADPVAPVISWRFYVPGICDETITIDLSQYDTVAQVLRTMELLAFIIGLAFVTREKFLRG